MSLTSLFSDIADAIRTKTGSSDPIVANNFPTAIASIPTSGGGETPRNLEFNQTTSSFVFDFGVFYDFLDANLTSQEKSKTLADTDGQCDWVPTFIIGSLDSTHLEICFDTGGSSGYNMAINLGIGDYSSGGTRVASKKFISSAASITMTSPLTFGQTLYDLRSDLGSNVGDEFLLFLNKRYDEADFSYAIGSGDNYVIPCSSVTVCFDDGTSKTIPMQNSDNYFIYSVGNERRA